ncbi:type VI secretion system FHA domain protein [Luteitalea pratensis]|uniref:Type VI secretion system FHA domain protein n=1 Tax=Luteitalea pratensis TaxID=1855912 RepID=A0A143PHU3_LUTPR|nr:type VI secretion system-associated FHA domain protein TagH [Luteitalea pratensis]AMY08105.1 type VI secretion system FHA domain protein [Luteitalea pratensis]
MGLILELVSSGAEQPPAVTRKVIGAEGGTIGRAKHSDWVLPDSKVSSRHARITYEHSTYYIEDTSTNGIYLNSPDNRLDPGRLYPLHAGERLLIQPYEILVSIVSDRDETRLRPAVLAPPPSVTSDPFRFDEPFGVVPGASTAPARNDPFALHQIPHPEDELDPLKLLDPGPPERVAPAAPAVKDLGGGSPLDGHFRPPAVILPPPAPKPTPPPVGTFIPDDYNPLAPETGVRLVHDTPPPFDLADIPVLPPPIAPGGGTVEQQPDTAPPFEAAAPVAGPAWPGPPPVEREPSPPPIAWPKTPVAGDLAGVLAAAGLQNVPVTPELAQKFGEILRVVVSGVMDVLRSRHHVKDEFRMRMTSYRPVDNNPLKFSVNVEDALHNLLVKRNVAYLGPVEAFQDAFDDLRNHQLAMLAGMRVAFETTLAEFDPDRLQEQFDRRLGKNSVFAVGAKMRYWDLFREHREEIARDPDAAFRRLFGDAFTRAYEEQLKRLKDGQGRG